MSELAPSRLRLNRVDWLLAGTRCALGGWFIYGGLMKGLHPVEFLRILHEYELPVPFFVLNAVAGLLPWFEILSGLLLVTGKALRAAALVWLVILVSFTLLVLQRALALQIMSDIPFCAVRFDCGCGMGEIGICLKLAENLFMMLAAATLLFCGATRGGPTNS